MLRVVEFTEKDQVLERYMELKAQAAERKANEKIKRALLATGKMMLKDALFLFFLLALLAAIVWVLCGIWIG